ncbi:hypothetical protein [Microtetraspora niveoalba]|uniref:hypothetical protein n=1 Tax=Microtetraspora niveoalba TaxID=46175 RepID=UPI000A51D3A5|nr:hypothetical protein [Microtetraspora niveoalba]
MKRPLIIDTHASSCYFRTSVEGDERKALVQITERCNLHCAHCFVSSGDWGDHMRLEDLTEKVFPRLRRAPPSRGTCTSTCAVPCRTKQLRESWPSSPNEGTPLGQDRDALFPICSPSAPRGDHFGGKP